MLPLRERFRFTKENGRLRHACPVNDPQHWLDRAKEARALAEAIVDLEAKRMMLGIADNYERLAQRAEERAARLIPLK
jgi:hypothetical protein